MKNYSVSKVDMENPDPKRNKKKKTDLIWPALLPSRLGTYLPATPDDSYLVFNNNNNNNVSDWIFNNYLT